jgi:hypothetical protein
MKAPSRNAPMQVVGRDDSHRRFCETPIAKLWLLANPGGELSIFRPLPDSKENVDS